MTTFDFKAMTDREIHAVVLEGKVRLADILDVRPELFWPGSMLACFWCDPNTTYADFVNWFSLPKNCITTADISHLDHPKKWTEYGKNVHLWKFAKSDHDQEYQYGFFNTFCWRN